METQLPTATPSHPGWKTGSPLNSTDVLLLWFWGILSLVSVLLHSRLDFWWAIPAVNIGAAFVLWCIARAAQSTQSITARIVHDWSAFPLVVFTYKQLYYLIRPVHHWRDYDQLLIQLDYFVFRVNPTEWLAQFSNPFLTELLQISYSLFYAIFVIIGYELYRDRDHSRFRAFRFVVVYGFLLSYVGYLALPSVGPRFTLHDFSRLNSELPGLLLTPALREFVNFFESISSAMPNSIAQVRAQRDVFPSGHTMITIVALVAAYQYRLRVRHFMLVVGILLIIATVYLRYHYVVDLLAGIILGIVCLLTFRAVYRLFGGSEGSF